MAGFVDTFTSAAAAGYQWAGEVHNVLISNATVFTNSNLQLTTLVNGWGSNSNFSMLSISNSSLDVTGIDFLSWSRGGTSGSDVTFSSLSLFALAGEMNWAAHYYDEGYDDGHTDGYDNGHEVGQDDGNNEGYDEGKLEGQEVGYDDGYDDGKTLGDEEGFEEAYPIAYEAAYGTAFDQGSEEGTFEGLLLGGEEGFDEGWTTGSDVGESVGFQLGADLYAAGGNLEIDFSVFRDTYAASVAASAAVPEPTSLCLGSLGLVLLASGQRTRKRT